MFYQHDHLSYRCHRGGTRWDFTLVGNKVRMVKWEKSVRKSATSGDKRNFSRYLRGRQLLYRGDIGVTRWMSRPQFASWCFRNGLSHNFLKEIDNLIPGHGEVINLSDRCDTAYVKSRLPGINQHLTELGIEEISRWVICPDHHRAGMYIWGYDIVVINSKYLNVDDYISEVLFHEIGHHIHCSVSKNDRYIHGMPISDMIEEKFIEIQEMEEWFPTEYSKVNCKEWWAECYAHYMMGLPMDDDVKNFVHSLLVSLRGK